MKFTPAMRAGMNVAIDSEAAWASATLEAQRFPPERNGTPRRRARAATVYRTRAGSGVPNVGAPVCIDIELANEPNTTGAPGFTSCTNVMPARASARVCAATPATVTGAMAPARMKGLIMVAWLDRAYASAAPSMVASQAMGEEALMRLVITVFCCTKSSPKTKPARSMESWARSAAVTDPMNALSL